MSSHRIRFNRSIFTASLNGHAPEEFIQQLAAEDIQLIIDVRPNASGESSTAVMDGLCVEAEMYYLPRPDLTGPQATERETAWAAGLAMRHRTCVVGDPGAERVETCTAIAGIAGMRVIDLETSPAPITHRHRPTA